MARSAQLTPLRLVLPGKSLRCQGVGTGGIVVQIRILGLLLECRFQGLQRLVGSLTQFRRHDDRQVELLALGGVSLLEPLQIRPRLVLVTQPGVGDGTELIGDGELRCLLDHDIEVVDRFLVLSQLEVSGRPSEPGVEIIRFRLEGGFRRLQSGRRHAPSCWAAEVPH